jgi:hypothetical protein
LRFYFQFHKPLSGKKMHSFPALIEGGGLGSFTEMFDYRKIEA